MRVGVMEAAGGGPGSDGTLPSTLFSLGSPIVVDLDCAGGVDVLATTREGLLFVWGGDGVIATDATSDGVEPALRFHHDARSSGNAHVDAESPAADTDLRAVRHEEQVYLAWTATGDDGRRGRAARYDVRGAPTRISCADWARAVPLATAPTPSPAEALERLDFHEPTSTVRFVAVRPSDESGNRAPVLTRSN